MCGLWSMTWSKDGAVLVNNSQVTIFEDQVTRGGLTFTRSVLQLCDTQDVNSGQYSCSIEGRVLCTHNTTWISLIFGKILYSVHILSVT